MQFHFTRFIVFVRVLNFLQMYKCSSIHTDHDLMFIFEAGYSMQTLIESLNEEYSILMQVVQLVELVDRVSILWYKDNLKNTYTKYSGWKTLGEAHELNSFIWEIAVSDTKQDTTEALYIALSEACANVTKSTICIMCVDSIPSHPFDGDHPGSDEASSQPFASRWLDICNLVHTRKMRVYPILSRMKVYGYPFYIYLSTLTRGRCLSCDRLEIYHNTLRILFHLAGSEYTAHPYGSQRLVMPFDFDYKRCLTNNSHKTMVKPIDNMQDIICNATLRSKRKDIPNLFNRYHGYRMKVWHFFRLFLTKERIMLLTHSPVFGNIWNLIRSEPENAVHQELIKKLDLLVQTSNKDGKALATFFNQSHRAEHIIDNILCEYRNDASFYVIDYEIPFDKKHITDIGANHSIREIFIILQIFRGLRISRIKPDDRSGRTYLPANMPPGDKFRMLSHLMLLNTVLPTRTAIIVAAIAKINGTVLKDDAAVFMNQSRGKWLDLSLPENRTFGFAITIMAVAEDALTAAEIAQINEIAKEKILNTLRYSKLAVEVGYSSRKTLRPDIKEQCKECQQWRSAHLIIEETCIFCRYLSKSVYYFDQKKRTSVMSECCICCGHFPDYGLSEDNPVCYSCTKPDLPITFKRCGKCGNKFMFADENVLQYPSFKCAVCQNDRLPMSQKLYVLFTDHIFQNESRFIGLDFSNLKHAFRIFSVDEEPEIISAHGESYIRQWVRTGGSHKAVLNSLSIQRHLLNIFDLSKNNLKEHRCSICFLLIEHEELHLICGQQKKLCTAKSCGACLASWYSKFVPGRVFQPAHLVCPCCKEYPTKEIVCKYNPAFGELMFTKDVADFDPSYVYAVCLTCHRIGSAGHRDESDGVLGVAKDYKCSTCADELDNVEACSLINENNETGGLGLQQGHSSIQTKYFKSASETEEQLLGDKPTINNKNN